MENEAQIKEYIEKKENENPITQLETLAGEVGLGKEKKEKGDEPHLFEWLKNDEKLLKYAELKMKEDDLKWGEKFKMELLELRLSITCSYFKDFQTFLDRMKHKNDVGRNTETNSIIEPNYEDPDNPYKEVPQNIDDTDLEQIAHLGSNWQNRGRGEKLVVDKEARKRFLFPDGLPKTKEEMESKYLVKITVPILDGEGNTKEKELQVHKKLANSYIAVFKELVSNGIKVDGNVTGAYCWRKIRRGNKQSEHSYGTAIDINWSYNGGVYGETDKNSIYYNNQTTVEIFKKYGFARGGDRSAQSDDPMHFTYLGG